MLFEGKVIIGPVPSHCGNQTEQHRYSGSLGGHPDLVVLHLAEALCSILIIEPPREDSERNRFSNTQQFLFDDIILGTDT